MPDQKSRDALKLLLQTDEAEYKKILEREEKEKREIQAKREEVAQAQAMAQPPPARKEEKIPTPTPTPEKPAPPKEETTTTRPPSDYIAKAQKLVSKLTEIRASIAPFDKSQYVKQRRLQMKRISNGRLNTLNHSSEKIKEVAMDVYKMIVKSKEEDDAVKAMMGSDASIPPEASKGRRYFVDLVACSVITRAEAEGFNG